MNGRKILVFKKLFIFACLLCASFLSPCMSLQKKPIEEMNLVSRVSRDEILVFENGIWSRIFIKGVNFGIALPGKFPSQFPTQKEDYLRWFRSISDMNANTIRVYHILPPVFYESLCEFNSVPENPKLWLIHGVWPPPDRDFYDEDYIEEYQNEMRHVVDIIHGNSSFPPRPGYSGGDYRSDISKYVLAFLIGKEWEPDVVYENDRNHKGITSFRGAYLKVKEGTPTECFLAKMCDYIVSYEHEKYGWQRPVSFINWPTLDPIHHPTEHEPDEDVEAYLARYRWHNDAVTVDELKIKATPLFKAGFFASYHIYPWNPDFMNNDPGYSSYFDSGGHPNNYAGYLHDLKQYHSGMPVVVAEFGVPTSRGNAHRQPQGMDHGAHTETEQGIIISRMMENIYDEGYAGGIVFNWIDEWWKTCWLVNVFELHSDGEDRLWHNAQDPEEYFGLLAMDSFFKARIDGEVGEWPEPFYQDQAEDFIFRWNDGYDKARDLKALYLESDSTFLYLRLDVDDLDCDHNEKVDWGKTGFLIGIDTYSRERGDDHFSLPTELKSPSGLEFVIDLRSESEAEILVDTPYDDYASPPTGKLRSVRNSDGKFTKINILTNRERIAEDRNVYPALYHSASKLQYGSLDRKSSDYHSLADWYASTKNNAIELRLPWYLLHVADPSKHLVLDDNPDTVDKLETAETTGFRIYVLSYKPREDKARKAERLNNMADLIPGSKDGFTGVRDYLWAGWEVPAYKERLKDSFFLVKEAFGQIGKEVVVTPFKNDAEAAVSIAFDDGKLSQYAYALSILEKYGFPASFGIATSLLSPEKIRLENAHLSQWMDWSYVKSLSEKGHEIASHSVEHVALPELSDEEAYRNLIDSKKEIEKRTGHPCLTFVYPFSVTSSKVKQAAEEAGYVCARSYESSYNESVPDYYELKSFAILRNDNPSLVDFTKWVVGALAEKKWLILVYHNVVPENDPELIQWKKEHEGEDTYNLYPSTFDSQMQIIKDVNVWVAPIGEVVRYLKERKHTQIYYEVDEDKIEIRLKSDLPQDIYNVPLTLKISTSWSRVNVEGSLSDGTIEVEKGEALVNASPNSKVTIRKEKTRTQKRAEKGTGYFFQ